ncbi:DUF3850 domain-containing protein [Lactiplantibacillus modestisalitolerans]|uniref:DUF3850 domain-containing protein n=1 Tax=Lactiplantibacillus modestisalitolerans TaxID=1457219 RepID=A0ABV5WVC8_9LACO|nr:DUF3850 domain-containing protein [Lactiplantibacillus modestisalitolerans]
MESSKIHELKIAPKYMDAQLAGVKNFEIRKNDRHFRVGDRLLLREWTDGKLTGRSLTVYVIYITDYQQRDGYVVLGTKPLGHTSDSLLEDAMSLTQEAIL